MKKIVTSLLATAIVLSSFGTAMAANDAENGGIFIDFNNLTWEANDGTVVTYGRGSVFSEVHPEITDPEYFLKESVKYPNEVEREAFNSQGKPKADYSAEIVSELQKFVNSFDWIHSDEFTRAQAVHDRISNGFSGNIYQGDMANFSVLMNGHGVCGDFAEEFCYLASLVGLECVEYTPSAMHAACLLKIGEQWYATDPTSNLPFLSNGKTYPVDFEAEYHRYEKEEEKKWEQGYAEGMDNPAMFIQKINLQLANGEITDAEFNAALAELMAYMGR